MIRIESHHAPVEFRPTDATACKHFSAKTSTGLVEASAMMTTTNMGSVKFT
jgi:hypothetical protein